MPCQPSHEQRIVTSETFTRARRGLWQSQQTARNKGLHKLSLDVFAHNTAAIALYHKFGFVEEGRRVAHYRRSSGELWDSIVMGLLL
jgi:RimJ/RimL family protein N-acetyltransferase